VSAGVVLAQWAVAILGIAVWFVWSRRVGSGRDPLGPPPSGALPDTRVALLAGFVVWLTLPFAVALLLAPRELPGATYVFLSAAVHAGIGLALLPFVRIRGGGTLTVPRRALAGVLAGLATFGAATAVGITLETAYGLAGLELPTQPVVALVQQARGDEWFLILAGAGALAPLGEEILYRATLLPALVPSLGRGRAVVVQGLVFGAMHVVGESALHWPLALPLAVVGMLCGWIYLRTRSLFAAVLLHATFNAINLAFLRWGT